MIVGEAAFGRVLRRRLAELTEIVVFAPRLISPALKGLAMTTKLVMNVLGSEMFRASDVEASLGRIDMINSVVLIRSDEEAIEVNLLESRLKVGAAVTEAFKLMLGVMMSGELLGVAIVLLVMNGVREVLLSLLGLDRSVVGKNIIGKPVPALEGLTNVALARVKGTTDVEFPVDVCTGSCVEEFPALRGKDDVGLVKI